MLGQPRASFGVLTRALCVLAVAAVALVAAQDAALGRGRHYGWSRPAPAGGRHHRHRYYAPIPSGPTDPLKDAALIADGQTGRVLYSRNASQLRHPASLTKMMTLYLLFEALKRGDVTMQTMLPISEHAASQRPTNLHLYAGDMIPVDTAIKAIVIRSANDVAVAIAEGLGGTEGHFAEMMTDKARALGMRDTFYHNASGLPDELQITTANDLLILARHLAYDFPQYFPYFATPSFEFRGTTYFTHDNLIGRYMGADGIKTGYTSSSGFNLVSSIVRNGTHVIGVVMGGRTAARRDTEMMRLLDEQFARIAVAPNLVAHNGVPWRNITTATPTMVASADVAPEAGDDEDAAESAASDTEALGNDQNVIAAPTPPRPNVGVQVAAVPPQQPPQVDYHPAPVVAYQPPPAQPQPHPALVAPPPKPVPAPPPRIAAAPAVTYSPYAPLSDVPLPRAKPEAPGMMVAAADMPKITPLAKPGAPATPQRPVQVAMASPPKPTPKPGLRNDVGEGDIGEAAPLAAVGPKAWTIQIGAFADMTQARTQLAAYAEKSMDVLGQAARIIIPFTAVDGHTLYRARFGPFVEREAREVCSRLTERGQTCFTVLASSR
ncbi:MAG: SPOR domain-containing protein [Alphaproteobacteria bacterium]|nr:SPOR domain-containing protein [Alphaproteobacteria bacterium]MBL6939565.1 SPOR domain-containing protein [Alphaproteobacteria bacterium]MBL7100062.1 SPOR domain-containing protein [Alphaproteobacteria bacterium]